LLLIQVSQIYLVHISILEYQFPNPQELVINGHLLHPYCMLSLVPKKKVLQVNIDKDVATDMDPCADEISGNKNGMA